ncbi:MAG TPA: hypothetical protein VER08_11550 [Pyrinomonadaceae bacterium]|nr:hypothetical protein [Pyrinomonadaceae bacterium]
MSRDGLNKFARTMLRGLKLRCPVCGVSSVVRRPFHIRHHCPTCNSLYMREEGFFVGPLMINVVASELAGLVFFFACVLTFGYSERLVYYVTLPLAALFAAGFYHHSWSIWLSIDYLVESLPQHRED